MWVSTNVSTRHPVIPAWSALLVKSLFRNRVFASSAHPSVLLPSAALLIAGAFSAMSAWAQHPASGVVEALQKKYQITQTTTDSEQVTKDGTTMVVKCAGIYSFPATSMILPTSTVVDGSIKSASTFTRMTWERMGSHVLQDGDKVYITKIENKGNSGDELRFNIVTVNDMDAVDGSQKKFRAVVSFKFKNGYLDETPPGQVEQAIEAILAPDTGDDSQAAGGAGGAGQARATAQPAPPPPPPPQRAAAPPPPPPAPAGPPPTISIGESSTQVTSGHGNAVADDRLGKEKDLYLQNHEDRLH